MLFRLSLKEILNNRKFSLFFILNLSVGLFGFIAIDTFKISLKQTISAHSKELLGADLSITSRRALTDEELQKIRSIVPAKTEEALVLSFLSMVAAPHSSHLVDVTLLPENFPFYGDLHLSRQGDVVGRNTRDIDKNRNAWLYPDLLIQLGVTIGEKIKIGGLDYLVSDTVTKDSGNTWLGTTIVPPLYVGFSSFKISPLIARGSVISHELYLKIPAGFNSEKLRNDLSRQITDPSVEINTDVSAGAQTAKALQYLDDYLGLTALVALFLAVIGLWFLLRSYFASKTKDIAILRCLGVTPGRSVCLFLLEAIFLGLAAFILISFLSFLMLPTLHFVVKSLSPFDLKIALHWQSVLSALILSVGGSCLLSLPFLNKVRKVRPLLLLTENAEVGYSQKRGELSDFFWLLPSFLAFWILAILQVKSWIIGTLFFLSLLLSVGTLWALGLAFLSVLRRIKINYFLANCAIKYITRRPVNTLSCFAAMSLSCLLLNLVPIIENSLLKQIDIGPSSELPSLFLFDIQPEQVSELKTTLEKEKMNLDSLSPLIRARIMKINDREFVKNLSDENLKTREDEEKERSRNRGINLTYRITDKNSDNIVEGSPLLKGAKGMGEDVGISVENKYAERMGFRLKDKITFEVQGVSISGKIQNFRRVKWTSFRPNFFIEFPEGVLEEAPKTFLASVAHMDSDKVAPLQYKIVSLFPNISVIDITQLARKIQSITVQMSWALKFMGLLCLTASLVVLLSIAGYQVRERKGENNLLKVLGVSEKNISKMVFFEFLSLGFLSCIIGILLSYVVSYIVSVRLFDSIWEIDLIFSSLFIVVVTLGSALLGFFSVKRSLYSSPLELLQEHI